MSTPLDQYAFEPTNDDNRQDDVLILVRFELSAEPLRGFPDVTREIIEFRLSEQQRHWRRGK